MNRLPLLIPVVAALALVIYFAGNEANRESTEEGSSAECTVSDRDLSEEAPPSPPQPVPFPPEEDDALLSISISPESRVKASAGKATPQLKQEAWTEFSIVIENSARMTAPLVIESAQEMKSDHDTARDRWLKIDLAPSGQLSGALYEERTVRLWSRDQGKRAAILHVNAGQGTQDLGFRSDVLITFDITPSDDAATQLEDQ